MRSPGRLLAVYQSLITIGVDRLRLHPQISPTHQEQGQSVEPVDTHLHVGQAAPRALDDRGTGARIPATEADPAVTVDRVLAMPVELP